MSPRGRGENAVLWVLWATYGSFYFCRTNISSALPGSELNVVEGCGHGIPFQKPEWFAQRVAGWLAAPS